MKINIKELLRNSKSRYIAITLIISAIGILKNVILLKFFDFDKLGLIALSQTFTTTISLFQLGVVTGGYRLFAYKKASVLKKINAAVLSSFLLLTAILIVIGLLVGCFFKIGISIYLLLLFIIIGVVSLYSNWVICKLLGTKNILTLNKAQLAGAVISFFVTLLAKWFGITAVFVGLILQPALIIIIAYQLMPELIPTLSFSGFRRYIKKIISLGFIPYLTSALTYFNSQLGRWLITFSLGTAILGRTFLVTLFVALISIFPAAISNLFFPSIIEKFEKNMKDDLRNTLKRQLVILVGYYALVILGTLSLANIVVKLFLPKQVESVYLIYAIIPALLFQHLSGPAITLFNAAKRFNQILIGSLISVFTYIILLALYLLFLKPQIVGFFIIESISALIFFIYNSYYYIKLNQNINHGK